MKNNIAEYRLIFKRFFDLFLSLGGLLACGWLIFISFVIASIDTKSIGFFFQKRVGQYGKHFYIIKIKTMKTIKEVKSTITTSEDVRITKSGKIFRKFKIDELPQLINVLKGDMSFVGPRPDVPGFADKLKNEDRIILSIKPGITGPASLYYKNEEEILANQKDPENYNKEIIYPHKVEINKNYIENYAFKKDLVYILKTIK